MCFPACRQRGGPGGFQRLHRSREDTVRPPFGSLPYSLLRRFWQCFLLSHLHPLWCLQLRAQPAASAVASTALALPPWPPFLLLLLLILLLHGCSYTSLLTGMKSRLPSEQQQSREGLVNWAQQSCSSWSSSWLWPDVGESWVSSATQCCFVSWPWEVAAISGVCGERRSSRFQ